MAMATERAASKEIQFTSGLLPVVDKYDAFLIDQWGVMHDGTRAYAGAVECVARLALLGKKIVLLSNSSKRKSTAFSNLKRMGFRTDAILDVVTSGELAWQGLADRKTEPFKSLGKRCFILGNGDDDVEYATSAGLTLSSLEAADFVLARGVFATVSGGDAADAAASESAAGSSEEPAAAAATAVAVAAAAEVERFRPNVMGNSRVEAALMAAAERGVPMLVTNPDFQRPGTNDPMPGMLGRFYGAVGGTVHYVGKPYGLVYDRCFELLAPHIDVADRTRICAVGDSLPHDVLGAISAGIGSVFVTGGVHHADLGLPQGADAAPAADLLEAVCAQALPRGADGTPLAPTHAVSSFKWM